jgi:hypothetical protein
MATNYEMIEEMAMLIDYNYNGLNLKTFAEWAAEGMIVKKGEKAIMQLELWKPFKKKLEEDGKPVIDPETGKQKEEMRFKLVMSSLFAEEQVQAGELKKKAKKAAPKKKAAAKKKTA